MDSEMLWLVAKRVPARGTYDSGVVYCRRDWPLDMWVKDVKRASPMTLSRAFALARRTSASVVTVADAVSHWRDIDALQRFESHLDITYQPVATICQRERSVLKTCSKP